MDDIRTKLVEQTNEPNLLFADGFDDAIVGVVEGFNVGPVVAYNKEAVLNTLVIRDGMTIDEAIEFFEFNIVGSYVGEFTPMFLTRIS